MPNSGKREYLSAAIAEFAHQTRFGHLPPFVIDIARRHLLDTAIPQRRSACP